jgi:hypothetical protein
MVLLKEWGQIEEAKQKFEEMCNLFLHLYGLNDMAIFFQETTT